VALVIYLASQPKAGTFFVAPILERLGFPWSRFHLTARGCLDLNGLSPAEIRAGGGKPYEASHTWCMNEARRRFGDSCVVTGHVGPTLDLCDYFADDASARLVVLMRDQEARMRSLARHPGTSPSVVRKAQTQARLVELWLDVWPDRVAIHSERGLAGALMRVTGCDAPTVRAAIEAVRGVDHGTYSGAAS